MRRFFVFCAGAFERLDRVCLENAGVDRRVVGDRQSVHRLGGDHGPGRITAADIGDSYATEPATDPAAVGPSSRARRTLRRSTIARHALPNALLPAPPGRSLLLVAACSDTPATQPPADVAA